MMSEVITKAGIRSTLSRLQNEPINVVDKEFLIAVLEDYLKVSAELNEFHEKFEDCPIREPETRLYHVAFAQRTGFGDLQLALTKKPSADQFPWIGDRIREKTNDVGPIAILNIIPLEG